MTTYIDFDLIQSVLREQEADYKIFVYPEDKEIVIRTFHGEAIHDFRDIKFNINGRMKEIKEETP